MPSRLSTFIGHVLGIVTQCPVYVMCSKPDINLFMKGFGYNGEDAVVAQVQGADYSQIVLNPDGLKVAVKTLVGYDQIRQVVWDGDEYAPYVSFTWGFPALFKELRKQNSGIAITSKKIYDEKKIAKYGGTLEAFTNKNNKELSEWYSDVEGGPPIFKVACNPDCPEYVEEAKRSGVSEDLLGLKKDNDRWKLLGQVSLWEEKAPKVVLCQGGGYVPSIELQIALLMGTESTWYVLHLRRPRSITYMDKDKNKVKECIKKAHDVKLKEEQGKKDEATQLKQELMKNCRWEGKYDSPATDWGNCDAAKVKSGYSVEISDGTISLPFEGDTTASVPYRKYVIAKSNGNVIFVIVVVSVLIFACIGGPLLRIYVFTPLLVRQNVQQNDAQNQSVEPLQRQSCSAPAVEPLQRQSRSAPANTPSFASTGSGIELMEMQPSTADTDQVLQPSKSSFVSTGSCNLHILQQHTLLRDLQNLPKW